MGKWLVGANDGFDRIIDDFVAAAGRDLDDLRDLVRALRRSMAR